MQNSSIPENVPSSHLTAVKTVWLPPSLVELNFLALSPMPRWSTDKVQTKCNSNPN